MSLKDLYARAKAAGIPLGEWAATERPIMGTHYTFTLRHAARSEREAADALDRMCRDAIPSRLTKMHLEYRHYAPVRWCVISDLNAVFEEVVGEGGNTQAEAVINAIEARKGRTQ